LTLEGIVTAGTVVLLLVDRIATKTYKIVAERRRAAGSNLHRAFTNTGGVMQELYELYRVLEETEGFHSLRMLSAHNSGHDLSVTMLWKGTCLATFPHDVDIDVRWDEQPLDPEYIQKILRAVAEDGRKLAYTDELQANGPLGALCRRKGIGKSMMFLIKKNDAEIVFASVAFSTDTPLLAEQADAIRSCEAGIQQRLRR